MKNALGLLLILVTLAIPQTTTAAIGSLSIANIERVAGTTYRMSGTWQPQAYPCWTPGDGGHFHYQIRIEDNGVPVTPNPMVVPAACNEDYRSPVSGANVLVGGNWPAIAHENNGYRPQPDAQFKLEPGSHIICAVLLRVNDDGLIIGQLRECSAKKILVPLPSFDVTV
ncbi:MAG: hypothetical protein HY340_03380 [Candidatus Kerfeldbacteria bacterium]|nr:hypothetical protein [Candidatus Kerfeldbacteria bacterium]